MFLIFFLPLSCSNNNPASSSNEKGITTVKDADGNVYNTVQIGNQVWTVENLRSTKYNDGTDIPYVTDSNAWQKLSTPGYCFYNNTSSASEREKWGALYNWYAVNTGKLAPVGWHVPTELEWSSLEGYVATYFKNYGGTIDSFGITIGKMLASNTDWISSSRSGSVGYNISTNNGSGFSFLPGGYCYGPFYRQGEYGCMWSATKMDESSAYCVGLDYRNSPLSSFRSDLGAGCSVRLVKN